MSYNNDLTNNCRRKAKISADVFGFGTAKVLTGGTKYFKE
jgi:hypothetical protein